MKYLILLLFTITSFAQTDTIYQKIIDDSSVDIERFHLIDKDLKAVISHKGEFRIGTKKETEYFPYNVKQSYYRSFIYVDVNYKFEGNRIIITAKNTIDDIVFPLGIQYYIVIRYTKK